MQTIIAQPGQHAHPDPDAAARQRRDRLAKATADQMESALALLSMIDPEAFEIAFTAMTDEISEDAEAIPLCRQCGCLVGIFPERGLQWQHFRATSSRPAASKSTTRAMQPRSPGSSPTRTRTNLSSCPGTAARRSPAGR